uniref:Protein kinase domain-containing protein n=1 Tax=Pyrodinium bahamense TaxID=73915 RepID=A0A7S0AJX0_9DINO|mmetsp:Transcript_36036/g.99942  ORF Transcript_36036/g.99942 Transcript_36036/m.99942 type:complete len:839 (+) Transcript_36036:116-2632(+)
MTTGCGCLPCGGGAGRAPQRSGPVTLNVGGIRYTTSRETLAGCQKLSDLVASPPGPDGTYFLDRDGRHFSEVLNFLRDGPELFSPPSEVDARRLLQREALFFGLQELAKSVQELYTGAPIPTNEEQRLEKLEGLNVMHTDDHEQHYDAITRIISATLDVPIALLSLVGDDHQWFKSRCGLDATQTPRNTSFCAMTFQPEVPTAAMMLVIENAKCDGRVCDNPLVTGEPFISFYAGCPLVTSDGFRLGALCAIDRVPRSINPLQAQILVNFAQVAVQEIERSQLLCGDLEGLDEAEDDRIPSNSDFAAGPLRNERMREALREGLCLVQVRDDSMDWPILYANEVWTSLSGVRITPPERFPGKAHAEDASQNGRRAPKAKELTFFSWLQLLGKTTSQLREEIRLNWAQQEPSAFALKGLAAVSLADTSAAPRMGGKNGSMSGNQERVTVTCRFMPAELPLDAAAAAIRPVPQREAGGPAAAVPGVTGRLYFVTTMRCKEPPAPALTSRMSDASASEVKTPQSTEGTPVGGDRRKSRGNTVDAVAAIKPPRSPFDDVRLLRLVGQGSFGKVYYGLWMGSPVAVKIIETRTTEQQRKFEPAFEAVLSASMAHPNLVQTFMSSTRNKPSTSGLTEEAEPVLETWMVQEWCDRGTLGTHCSKPRSDPESLIEVMDICIDIAGAGAYLHSRGIIHGDLTANNVLIKTQVSRKGYVCKICDFGLARVLEGDTTDIMTTQLGTVTHMPPELFGVGQEVRLTTMADIYAAGVLMWQAVKGEPPFFGLSPPQVVVQIVKGKRLKLPEEVPQEINEVFMNCTAPEPEDRPTFDGLVKTFSGMMSRSLGNT